MITITEEMIAAGAGAMMQADTGKPMAYTDLAHACLVAALAVQQGQEVDNRHSDSDDFLTQAAKTIGHLSDAHARVAAETQDCGIDRRTERERVRELVRWMKDLKGHGYGWAVDAAEIIERLQAKPDAASTLPGMIASIYGNLDAEDCAMVDREWARMRGYVLPNDGTSTLSRAAAPAGALRETLTDLIETAQILQNECEKSFVKHNPEAFKLYGLPPSLQVTHSSINSARAVLPASARVEGECPLEVLEHLGNALYFCAAVPADARNEALDNALAYYNQNMPRLRMMP